MRKFGYPVLVIILFIEILYFFGLTQSVHSTEDVVFIVTVIIVSLVLGITGLLLFSNDKFS